MHDARDYEHDARRQVLTSRDAEARSSRYDALATRAEVLISHRAGSPHRFTRVQLNLEIGASQTGRAYDRERSRDQEVRREREYTRDDRRDRSRERSEERSSVRRDAASGSSSRRYESRQDERESQRYAPYARTSSRPGSSSVGLGQRSAAHIPINSWEQLDKELDPRNRVRIELLNIAKFLKENAQRRQAPSRQQVRRLADRLDDVIENTRPQQLTHPATVSQWSYGLPQFALAAPGQETVDRLMRTTIQLFQGQHGVEGRGISNLMYNLRGFGNSPAVEDLFETAIVPQLSRSDLRLEAQNIGNALYGLQNMRDSEPVQAVLKAMAGQLNLSGLQLNAQNIGNALYGLQNMRDSEP
ncbi:MAG TPA: hypothetical protein VFS42_09465, partial [Burkholderiaceae bacterium]|nr:hypothetical protein [Burkholderiaceae bacterium]